MKQSDLGKSLDPTLHQDRHQLESRSESGSASTRRQSTSLLPFIRSDKILDIVEDQYLCVVVQKYIYRNV
jgi:hypothetical protein